MLDGSGSGGAWGTNVTYSWALTTPTSGVTVTFDDNSIAEPTVTIAQVTASTDFVFTLTVTGRASGNGSTTATDTAAVTTTTPNSTPTVENVIPDQTATAGAGFTYQFPANTFDDTDTSDTLSYMATKADDTDLPTWLSFDAATRTFTGTPTAADLGTVSVKVTATDTGSATVSDEFNIVVIPAAPAGFTAEAGDGRVRLVWTEPRPRVVHEYRYAAGASVPADAAWTSIGFSDQSTVLISGLANGTAHAFEVRVVGSGGVGPGAAAAVSATPAVAACSAPNLGGRRSVWSATLTVGRVGFGSAGYRQGSTPYGSLSPSADFSIGGTSYTIASLETIVRIGNRRQMFLDLAGSGTFPDAVRTALQFHWCGDSSGLDAPIPDYQITDDNDADWSIHTTREVALSLPANNDATGAPAVTGTAQVGQTLTAGKGDIADPDVLPATFPDDYAFQWVRVDADGTSNATDITNATANAYTLTADDVGKRVRVRVSFFDVLGGDEEILGALSGEVVSAPPAVSASLVSNLGQTEAAGILLSAFDVIQGFETGAGAYTLTSVDLRLKKGTAGAVFTIPSVKLTQGTTSGSSVTLTGPEVVLTAGVADVASGTANYTFTAPANTTLTGSTEYFIVVETVGSNSQWLTTSLPGEDATPADGWTINNNRARRNSSSTGSFTTRGRAQLMSINGITTTPPPPANTPPVVANAIPDQTATAGTAFRYAFPDTTFTDADSGDTLIYKATKGDGATLPSWLTFDPGTRAFSGTPTAADVGRVSVKVTATDTSSATASGDFDIVVSAATTTTPPATGSLVSNLGQTQHTGSLPLVTWDVVQGFAIDDTASSNDYTLTSIDLRLSRDAGGTSIGAPGVQLVEGTKTATSVTFTGSPVTLTADVAEVTSTTGENYRFTAPSGTVLNASKRYFIRVEHVGTRVRWMTTAATGEDASPATDAGWSIDDERWRRSATNTGDFTNKVARSQLLRVNGNTTTSTNSAPTVATVIPDQTATEGTEFSYTFLPTTFNDTDAGDTLTYSATKADDTDLPTWLSFDAATRTFTGTPAAADLGTVSVKVTATDTGSATVSDDFDIVVIAAPPAGFRADEGDGRVRLVWTEPTPIIDHEYRYAAGASVPADTAWTVIGDAEQSTILISGLANGTAHAFEVRVVGSGGVSPGAAAAVSATPAVAACSAPNLGGRRSVWSATLTVGHMEFTSSYAAGYENRQGNTPYGSLSPSADFSIGGTSYTIALLETILRGRDRRTMFLGLAGSGTFPDAVRTALQLHWCGNSSGLQFLNPLYTVVNNNRADWSLHTTREVALSLPANNDATGTPTVTGTAQAGETLTAGMGNITDADGLPATFPGDYAFQWVRVDADGTSNATDITNATANAYTLTADDVGKRVRVRVSFFDVLGGDEEIPGALSGEVVSAPPANATPTVANEIPNQTAEAGTDFSYQFPANAFNDTDSGDALSYTATKPDDSALPTWLGFDAATRTFKGTPAASDVETVAVKVTATDTSSATISDEFNIVVSADTTPPTLTSATVNSTGTTISFQYSERITDVNIPQASAFTVTADGIAVPVDQIGVVGGSFLLQVSPVLIRQGQTVVLTYTDPTTGDDTEALQDAAGNDVATFTTGMNSVPAVTNSSTLAAVAPDAPTSLTATASGTDTIKLSWTAPVDNGGSVITGYKIEVSTDSGTTWTDLVANTAATATAYDHTGLAASTTRHYRVSAINSIGAGTASDVVDATTGTAANNAPVVANAIPDQTAEVGTEFSYQFPTNTFNDTDAGDTLSYTATKGDGANLPTWLGFTPGTRTFAGTPAASDVETVAVKVTADDSNGGLISDVFDIVVSDPNAGICARTEAVRDALLAKITGVTDCALVTDTHLAAITGTLLLNDKSITALAAGDFDGLTALTVIDLTDNPVTALPAGVFDELTALLALGLTDNSLTGLPADVFDKLTALRQLFLNGNSLTALPAGVFDELTALTELYLNGNSLTALPADVFDELTALRQLFLNGNSLTALPAGVFDELTALTELYLNGNSLTALPAGVFDGLTALTLLDLDTNSLTALPDDVFEPLTSLTSLDLSGNTGAPFSPTAVALPDDGKVPAAGGSVMLDGSGSGGAWGTNVTYAWTLTTPTSGVTVTFDDAAIAEPTVTIPQVTAGTDLVFTLTVTGRADSSSDSISTGADTATVTPTTNAAPTLANAIPDRTATAGAAFSYQVPANTFNDTDTGDTLSYSATKPDDTTLPTWLTFTAGTRTFTGTPAATDVETLAVKVTADDSNGGTVSDEFNIVVSAAPNNAPTFADNTLTRGIAENTAANVNVGAVIPAATDTDSGDTLTYTMEGTDAASFDFNATTRQITTKTGVTYDFETKSGYSVTIKVDDNNGGSDTVDVTITLTDANEPPAAPAAPAVTATSGSTTSLDVSWTAPGNSGKPAITSYDLQYRAGASGSFTDGPQNVTGTATTIASLNPGTLYQVQVRATNDEGDSGWSGSGSGSTNSLTTNNAPAFADNTLTRGIAENTAANVNVGAVIPAATDTDSGDTLTYTMEGTDAASFDFNATTRQITTKSGVTYDFETKSGYSVTIKVDDNNGGSDTVAVTITLTDANEPPTAPAAPTVTATSGSTTSLDVSWTAPGNSGKPAITSYDLQYRAGASGSFTDGPQNVTGTATTIASLSPGTLYQVQVRATNDEGDSGWSGSGSGSTTALATNNAPVVANPIPDQTVSLGASFFYFIPANTFSDADDDTLTYTATQADGSTLPTWLIFTPAANRLDFRGTPGASDVGVVSVKVTVSDGKGGSVSNEFNIFVESATQPHPSAVRDLRASAQNGEVLLDWRSPALSGQSAIARYEYRYARGSSAPSSASWQTVPAQSGTARTVGPLDSGVQYTFEVRAVNESNIAGAVTRVRATPTAAPVKTLPDPPRSLTAVSGGPYVDRTQAAPEKRPAYVDVTLNWSAPSGDGNDYIVRYEYRGSKGSSVPSATSWSQAGSDTRTATLRHLDPGAGYTFEVRAVTLTGAGAPARTQLTTTPFSAPSVTLSVSGAATEGEPFTLSAVRTGTLSGDTTVFFEIQDNAYAANQTWHRVGTFRAGNSRASATYRPDYDGKRATGRQFTVRIGEVYDQKYAIDPAKATVTVRDNDVGLSVADAQVQEGPGARLEFAVSLSRTLDRAVTVNYATGDGTATAGADYIGASSTLTIPAGSRERTVVVSVLDDGHNEGVETLTLTLSNASGALLDDAVATGRIVNSDPMPQAWLARFGRAATDHTVQAIERRWQAGEQQQRESHLTIGGRRFDNLLQPWNATALGGRSGLAPEPEQMTTSTGVTIAPPAQEAPNGTDSARMPDGGADPTREGVMQASPAEEAPAWQQISAQVEQDSLLRTDILFSDERERLEQLEAQAAQWRSKGAGGNAGASGMGEEMSGMGSSGMGASGMDMMSGGGAYGDSGTGGAMSGGPGFAPRGAASVGESLFSELLLKGLRKASGAPAPKLRDVAMGSSFFYQRPANPADQDSGWLDNWAAWGETAATRFSGVDGKLSLDGEVATATMGVDSRRGRWLGGIALSLSEGEGAYRHPTAAGGLVTSTLASVNPYAHFQLNDRTSVWGVLGYGRGGLTLTPESNAGATGATGATGSLLESDLISTMAAIGGRGVLTVQSNRLGSFQLALVSDARITSTASRAIEGLVGVQAETSRARLLLAGSGSMPLGAFGALSSTLEAGLRYDGGDAETGAGFEIGGGLGYSFGQLQVRVNARTLLTHANADYEEWGYNTSIEYRPGANGQGLLLKLGSAWGMDQSGVQSMWSQETARGLARGGPMSTGQRYQAELGYGVKTRYRERFWYPYLAAESYGYNNQAYRLGLNLTVGEKMEAGLEFGQRLGLPGEKPQNAIALRGEYRF